MILFFLSLFATFLFDTQQKTQRGKVQGGERRMAQLAQQLCPHRDRRNGHAQSQEDHQVDTGKFAKQNEHAHTHREQESIRAAGRRPQRAQEPTEANQAGPLRRQEKSGLHVQDSHRHTRRREWRSSGTQRRLTGLTRQ